MAELRSPIRRYSAIGAESRRRDRSPGAGAVRRPRSLTYAVASWSPRPADRRSSRNRARRAVLGNPMTGTSQSTPGRRRRARLVLIFAALCAALIAVAAVSSAGAKNAKVLGKTRHTPNPVCPKNCSGVGSVTAFMRVADGVKFPFKVHRNGKLVAYALDLSRPSKKQRNFFGKIFKSHRFGKTPTARIAVLRQNRHKRKKYRLLRQSPTVRLSSALGRKEVFTLDKPLRIRKGQVVALTVPTWASNFATQNVSSSDNQWRASRKQGQCNTSNISNAKKSTPQQKVDSVRHYSCDYNAARILYWGYYVPK
jgi:hypothetical protein